MIKKTSDKKVNTSALSRKYKCDVNKIISLFKKDKNDYEISCALGIDVLKVLQVRQDIASFYERERQQRLKKNKSSTNFFTVKPR